MEVLVCDCGNNCGDGTFVGVLLGKFKEFSFGRFKWFFAILFHVFGKFDESVMGFIVVIIKNIEILKFFFSFERFVTLN